MSKSSPYILAALASAVAPTLDVVAVNDAHDLEETGRRRAIDLSIVLDSSGTEYDIAVSQQPAVGPLLQKRLLAAKLLDRTEPVQALGFRCGGAVAAGVVDGRPVIITRHLDGLPLPFQDLSPAQCASLGTAIAAIHLLDTDFLTQAAYPCFTAESIRTDLASWAARLKSSVEVPKSIVERWEALTSVDGLWDFTPRVVHGSFCPNDVLFHHDSVRAMRNWENIQVSDPAHDFAWAYEDSISEQQRDALLSAYGRMMGSQMDSRIVPRARLWRQMDSVRDLLQALAAADRPWIRAARERIEALDVRLAPQVPLTPAPVGAGQQEESSTITVGALLTGSGQAPQPSGRGTAVEEPSAQSSGKDLAAEATGQPMADPALEASRLAVTDVFAKPAPPTPDSEPFPGGRVDLAAAEQVERAEGADSQAAAGEAGAGDARRLTPGQDTPSQSTTDQDTTDRAARTQATTTAAGSGQAGREAANGLQESVDETFVRGDLRANKNYVSLTEDVDDEPAVDAAAGGAETVDRPAAAGPLPAASETGQDFPTSATTIVIKKADRPGPATGV